MLYTVIKKKKSIFSENQNTDSRYIQEDLAFPSISGSRLSTQNRVPEENDRSQVEVPPARTPAPIMPDEQRLSAYIRPNSNPTGAQLRNAANKRAFPMLTDEDFLADKKKKLFLEIEEIESLRNARERKDKLEEELTRAKIDELKARKEFFETMTEGIKKKVSAALLNEYFSEE